jgi:hypothetical protein
MIFLLYLLVIFLLFAVHSAFVIYAMGPMLLLQPTRRREEWYARLTRLLHPSDAGLPQEDLQILTRDGLKLDCWLIQQPRAARGTMLYLHGVGDCKIDGVRMAQFLFRHGYNVFLYDSRQHGQSEGSFCTYGFYEKYDVSSVIDYLESRKDLRLGPIGIFGTSMGGAVAIQTAAIDRRISAIVAQASFTELRKVFVDYQKRITRIPWHFIRNVAIGRSQKMANFKARFVSPLEDVKRLHCPILFIHGTEDVNIKPEYSRALHASAHEPKKLLLIHGAQHNDVWDVGGKVYEQALEDFFLKYVNRKSLRSLLKKVK